MATRNTYLLDTPIEEFPRQVSFRDISAEPEVFFDGDRFLEYIQRHFSGFDVATYSLSRSADAPLRKVRRLLTNLPLGPCGLRPEAVRVVANNHAKVFLCYDGEALACVYVGSQNLTHGTQINIMVRVDYLHNKRFLNFFDTLWNTAKP